MKLPKKGAVKKITKVRKDVPVVSLEDTIKELEYAEKAVIIGGYDELTRAGIVDTIRKARAVFMAARRIKKALEE